MPRDDTTNIIREITAAERREQSDITLMALNQVDEETIVRLSELSLPEIADLKEHIASIFPAGNLPGLILSGLTTLNSRHITRQRAQQDIDTLFKGAGLVPKGIFSILVGGPAVVLSAYQSILKLAGKDSAAAFPDGTWQFYLQFALREDTGRHTSETLAYFQRRVRSAALVDDLSAWIMTATSTLFDTDSLNGCLWSEWTTLRLIQQAAAEAGMSGTAPYSNLLRAWQAARPYTAPAMASYADVRRRAFNEFLAGVVDGLLPESVAWVRAEMTRYAEEEQDAYQQQMSLLARLIPGKFRDEREPVPLWKAHVGVIWRGHTYLFPAAARDDHGRPRVFSDGGKGFPLTFDDDGQPLGPYGNPLSWDGPWLYRMGRSGEREYVGYLAPAPPEQVKAQVEAITRRNHPPSVSRVESRLVNTPRGEQERLRRLLPEETRDALDLLATAPILINWDEHDRDQPLGQLRREARRGIGDHPLTVIRTGDSIVFDQSHIFFDGLWGMAIAEAMTNQAIAWAGYMKHTRPADSAPPPPDPLRLVGSPEFESAALVLDRDVLPAEVDAEITIDNLSRLNQCRRWLRDRGASLTINDLLLLARIYHGASYRPASGVARRILALPDDIRTEVTESLDRTSIDVNPAVLIPMDASLINPRERIFPTTFRSSLAALLDVYDRARTSLGLYENSHVDADWYAFDAARSELVAYLRAFGETLDVIKAIAMRGESFNTSTLRLLGNLPPSMQHLLNQIPEHIGLLNEVLKGEEVFSNVGRVAAGSSLVRFMSAKDDGRAKTLVWGILTDDQDAMHISLRDFRPHVGVLLAAGEADLAHDLAADYVASYARVLDDIAATLGDIVVQDDVMRWG